jgi:uncharacterized membrane protein YfcA
MAYGVISSTVLLGVPPAQASASAHAAEVFTTAASGIGSPLSSQHRLETVLATDPLGVAGGMLGAFVLTSFGGDQAKPIVTTYWKLAVASRQRWNFPLAAGSGQSCH